MTDENSPSPATRWYLPERIRQAVMSRQAAIAIDPATAPREAIAAAKCLLEMEKQNQVDEHRVAAEATPELLDHPLIRAAGSLHARLIADEDYVEYLRQCAIKSHAGDHGDDSQRRPLADGAAPGAARPRTHGDSHGEEPPADCADAAPPR